MTFSTLKMLSQFVSPSTVFSFSSLKICLFCDCCNSENICQFFPCISLKLEKTPVLILNKNKSRYFTDLSTENLLLLYS